MIYNGQNLSEINEVNEEESTEQHEEKSGGHEETKADKKQSISGIRGWFASFFSRTTPKEEKIRVFSIHFKTYFEICRFFEILQLTQDNVHNGDIVLYGIKIAKEEVRNDEIGGEMVAQKYCYYFLQEGKRHLIQQEMNYILENGIVYINRQPYRRENEGFELIREEMQSAARIKYSKISFLTLAFLYHGHKERNYDLIENPRAENIDTCYLIELFLKIKDNSQKLIEFKKYLELITKENLDYAGTVKKYTGTDKYNATEYSGDGFIYRTGTDAITINHYIFKNLHFIAITKGNGIYGCILPDAWGIKVKINTDDVTITYKDKSYNIAFQYLEAFSILFLSRPHDEYDDEKNNITENDRKKFVRLLEYFLEYFTADKDGNVPYEQQQITQGDLRVLTKTLTQSSRELSLGYMFRSDAYDDAFLEVSAFYTLFPVLGMPKEVVSCYGVYKDVGEVETLSFSKTFTIYNRNGEHFFCVYLGKDGNFYSNDRNTFKAISNDGIYATLKKLNIGKFKSPAYITTRVEDYSGNNCLLFATYFAIFYEMIQPNSSLLKRSLRFSSKEVCEYFKNQIKEELVNDICQKIDDECIIMVRRLLIEQICIQLRIYYKIIALDKIMDNKWIEEKREINKFSDILRFECCMQNMVAYFKNNNPDGTAGVFGDLKRDTFCIMSLVNIYFLIDVYITQEDFIDYNLGFFVNKEKESFKSALEIMGSDIVFFINKVGEIYSKKVKEPPINPFLSDFLIEIVNGSVAKMSFSELRLYLGYLIETHFGKDTFEINDDFFDITKLTNHHARKLVLDFEVLTNLVCQFYEKDKLREEDNKSLDCLMVNYFIRGYFDKEDKLKWYYCENENGIEKQYSLNDSDSFKKLREKMYNTDGSFYEKFLGTVQNTITNIKQVVNNKQPKSLAEKPHQKSDDILSFLFILLGFGVFFIVIYNI